MPSASTAAPSTRIRSATPADVPRILDLVRELAAYEREPDAVEASEEDFARALFPEQGEPRAFCHVAEVANDPGDGEAAWEVVAMALWFLSFSTWTGKHGIWLEDLFVRPEQRGFGLGKALLATLAAECVERGYQRLEWWVLDWNEPAIGFYRALGAAGQEEWTTYRMTGTELQDLAALVR